MANNVETSYLKKSRVLQAVHRLSREEEVYLVGGAVRDLLSGQPPGKDFDLVMKGEVGGLAKALAQETKGHAFVLDESFGTWRVILKRKKGKTEIDLSPLQGKDIIEDLRQRDFTVNSIALGLKEMFSQEALRFIDPLNGWADIRKGIIRANSEESLLRDPLRMLRAFRFSATLGFSLEEETRAMIRRNCSLILGSAWERIRSEFFAALGEDQGGDFLRQLNEAGLLGEILPEIRSWKSLDLGLGINLSLLEHALRTVEAGEFILIHLRELYPAFSQSLDRYFSQSVEEGITRKSLFKFVAFLHDSGKPGTTDGGQEGQLPRFLDHDQEGQRLNTAIARRMKLSRGAVRIISDLTRQHMRIHSLSRAKEVTPRARYRFFQDLGKEGIDLVFLALSSGLASKSLDFHRSLSSDLPGDLLRVREAGRELLRYYYEEFAQRPQKPLLDGKEIMEALGIPQGKTVGKLLRRLREAEIAGKVQTREEALKFLKNIDRPA